MAEANKDNSFSGGFLRPNTPTVKGVFHLSSRVKQLFLLAYFGEINFAALTNDCFAATSWVTRFRLWPQVTLLEKQGF